jgi:hypothetical protein
MGGKTMKKRSVWKITCNDSFTAWVLFLKVEKGNDVSIQLYQPEFKSLADAQKKCDELNGKK